MKRLKTLIPCLLAVGLAGCAGPGPQEKPDTGLLSETAGGPVPEGMVPAYIYEIDGRPVLYGRGTHRVVAGEHTLRVWPERYGPRSETPNAERLNIEPMTLAVESGNRYYIAAVVRRHRIYARHRELEPLGPWQRTILPVIAQTADP